MTQSNLEGTWKFTQSWGGGQPYSFLADFSANGEISINNGMFFGTYAILGQTNQISLAIADFNGNEKSITAYVGNIMGGAMGGQARGAKVGGNTSDGVWSAQKVSNVDENKGFHVPS